MTPIRACPTTPICQNKSTKTKCPKTNVSTSLLRTRQSDAPAWTGDVKAADYIRNTLMARAWNYYHFGNGIGGADMPIAQKFFKIHY